MTIDKEFFSYFLILHKNKTIQIACPYGLILEFIPFFPSLSHLKNHCRSSITLPYKISFFCVWVVLFNFFSVEKTFANFWKISLFAKITFANFDFTFFLGINFREKGPKSRKSRKFLPAKVSALKVITNTRS